MHSLPLSPDTITGTSRNHVLGSFLHRLQARGQAIARAILAAMAPLPGLQQQQQQKQRGSRINMTGGGGGETGGVYMDLLPGVRHYDSDVVGAGDEIFVLTSSDAVSSDGVYADRIDARLVSLVALSRNICVSSVESDNSALPVEMQIFEEYRETKHSRSNVFRRSGEESIALEPSGQFVVTFDRNNNRHFRVHSCDPPRARENPDDAEGKRHVQQLIAIASSLVRLFFIFLPSFRYDLITYLIACYLAECTPICQRSRVAFLGGVCAQVAAECCYIWAGGVRRGSSRGSSVDGVAISGTALASVFTVAYAV
jgi:hypothetical protein